MNNNNNNNQKVVFMGTLTFSAIILKALLDARVNVVLVVTKEDTYDTKKKKYIYPLTKELAIKSNIEVFQPSRLKDNFRRVLEVNPSLVITASYGNIVPKEIINSVKCINIHASLLPSYRGASPIQASLLNGDKITGVTIMEMAYKMDAGDIIYQEKLYILDNDNFTSLLEKLALLGSKMLLQKFDLITSNNYIPIKQNENDVTLTHLLKKEDEIIDFNNNSESIVNKVRALSDNLGGTFSINNIIYKVYKCKICDIIYSEYGTVIENKKRLVISSNSGSIEILEIQESSKKRLAIKDFLNGNKNIKVGDKVDKKECYQKQ
ncbi:MAG: methionyl-tRNA formyltransferase [Acholeplasmatales bacterium]|jgi:methionyl-tRNA formyltransferase|nr:methionyl-tRNA formyltransferase [Acholeplasmatales bacterium]